MYVDEPNDNSENSDAKLALSARYDSLCILSEGINFVLPEL